MKQTLLFAALGLVAAGAGAQEVGRVLSSTPVIQQVAVPRTYCSQPTYVAPPPTSGAGGVMGAIAGGAIGSTIGHGTGTAAAVLLGTIGGAIVGNNIEAGGQRPQAAQVCSSETTYENRAMGYNVTYEYAGREYSTQLPYDPGPTIQLQVSPVSSGPSYGQPPQAGGPVTAPPISSAAPVAVAPMVMAAPVVVQSYPAYPAYPVYAPVYRPYPPIGVSLNFGFGGHRHHHHRRWR
ncbi:MAG: hypothetical protein EOO30_15825 [Comamonadaceae bacterium]|nr:MAG: hypothetical protein EOO30_15825 [Comamonadaceae bacterium]